MEAAAACGEPLVNDDEALDVPWPSLCLKSSGILHVMINVGIEVPSPVLVLGVQL